MMVYPHTCRDDHIEIGHSDSENERCPVCRLLDSLIAIMEECPQPNLPYACRVNELAREAIHSVNAGERLYEASLA